MRPVVHQGGISLFCRPSERCLLSSPTGNEIDEYSFSFHSQNSQACITSGVFLMRSHAGPTSEAISIVWTLCYQIPPLQPRAGKPKISEFS